jgi:acyl carrier protein
MKTENTVRSWLRATVARHAKVPVAAVDVDAPFHTLGIDSVTRMTIVDELSQWMEVRLPQLTLEEHPTIERVVAHLTKMNDGADRQPAGKQT